MGKGFVVTAVAVVTVTYSFLHLNLIFNSLKACNMCLCWYVYALFAHHRVIKGSFILVMQAFMDYSIIQPYFPIPKKNILWTRVSTGTCKLQSHCYAVHLPFFFFLFGCRKFYLHHLLSFILFSVHLATDLTSSHE